MPHQLPYRVRCKSTYPFFEVIAAFNIERAAVAYAEECKEANPRFTYRVCLRGKTIKEF